MPPSSFSLTENGNYPHLPEAASQACMARTGQVSGFEPVRDTHLTADAQREPAPGQHRSEPGLRHGQRRRRRRNQKLSA